MVGMTTISNLLEEGRVEEEEGVIKEFLLRHEGSGHAMVRCGNMEMECDG